MLKNKWELGEFEYMADEFLTKSEHEEFAKRIEETNARQNKRLEILEESVKDINRLASFVC